jgi:transcriptional regulator with XRE-family HTH domain
VQPMVTGTQHRQCDILVDVDAADLLVAIRRRQGLTQSELARRAGTSQPVVSAYEHGRRDPSISTLRRLVEASGERLVLEATTSGSDRLLPGDAAAHGRLLFDVLSLADAVPTRRRSQELNAPRLVSRS